MIAAGAHSGGSAQQRSPSAPSGKLPRKSVLDLVESDELSAGAKKRIERRELRRSGVYRFIDDPSSGYGAFLFSIAVFAMVLASVVTLCLQTVPCYADSAGWRYLEYFFNSAFTLELVVRLMVVESYAHAIKDVYLYFDVAAVAPFWIVLIAGSGTDSDSNSAITLLKALRMLRLLKLSRQYDGSLVIYRALKISLSALGVPFYFLAVAVTLFATLLYYLEETAASMSGACGEQNPNFEPAFRSIPHAIWFMLVTMTTVGYGDVWPKTDLGRAVTGMAMIFGVLFLSMPLAIVGNNFVSIWDDRKRLVFVEKFKKSFNRVEGITRAELIQAIEEMDADGSGTISFAELRTFMHKLKLRMSLPAMRQLWTALDKHNSGEIDCKDFAQLFFEDEDAEANGSEDDDIHMIERRSSSAMPAPRTSRETLNTQGASEAGSPSSVPETGGDVGDVLMSIQQQLSKLSANVEKLQSDQARILIALGAKNDHQTAADSANELDSQTLDISCIFR